MSGFFLEIVNMSISASWIVLAVLLLRLLLKKAPKWMTVLLWGIVAIRLICPFSIESVMSLIPSTETISPEIMMEKEPAINSGVPIINDVVNPVIGESFSPDPGTSANPLQILIPVLSVVWIVGIAVMLIYTVISYLHVKCKISTAVLLRDHIFQSERVVSPFVLGIIKPRIYLPFHMNEQDMEHVIAHENAHIRRKDYLWKPFGFLVLTLHWFNPFIWLSYVLLCRDIELACDEKVVKELDNRQKADYAQALLNCSVNRRMIAACPLAFGELGVKDRVKSVLNYRKPAFWIIVVAIIASVVVAVCFLTDPVAEEEEKRNENDSESTVPDQLYVQFLDGEIAAYDNGQKKFLNEYLSSFYGQEESEFYYAFLDMTGDGTDELCIKKYQLYFFTIKDGNLHHWCTEGTVYTDLLSNGALFDERHGGGPTNICYKYYELDKNGSVSFERSFEWYDGTTVEEGKVYPDIYFVDDIEVTKEEYEEKTNEYLSLGKDKVNWYEGEVNDAIYYDPEEIITVNYNVAIVESIFRIPVKYQLSDTLKEKGFLSIEKKEDGLAVYKIKRKDYVEYISQLEASKKEIFDRYNTDYYPYVTSVSYNDDLTKITIAVNKIEYENVSYENGSGYLQIRKCIIGCRDNVALYHSLSTGSFKECEIEIIDSNTGDILETIYSTESLLDNPFEP